MINSTPASPVVEPVAAPSRDRLSDQASLYRRNAAQATERADREGLANVRETFLRSARRWTDMAEDLDVVVAQRSARIAKAAC